MPIQAQPANALCHGFIVKNLDGHVTQLKYLNTVHKYLKYYVHIAARLTMFSHFTSRLRTVDNVNLMTYENIVALLHASLEDLHIVCMTCTEKSNIYCLPHGPTTGSTTWPVLGTA